MVKNNKFTRRDFVKRTAVAGAGVALLSRFAVPSAKAAPDPSRLFLRKWIQPLRGLNAGLSGPLGDPNGIPVATGVPDPVFADTTFYEIVAGEFKDQIHPDLPPTTLWGYWDKNNPIQKHLGGVIIATRPRDGGTATRLRMTNALPDLHLFPVDTTLPGAAEAHNRIALHLHGGWVPWISDGGPFDWWTPGGPAYATGMSFQNGPTSFFNNIPTNPMLEGQADYYWPNDQSSRLMWYHDHAHGTTRLNAYAGLATGYLVLDGRFIALAGGAANYLTGIPGVSKLPGLLSTIPLVFQGKEFVGPGTAKNDPTWAAVAPAKSQTVGSLWYEHIYDPNVFALAPGASPLPAVSCIPEFFDDTILCNGTAYPVLTVEAKRYRFLMLNATNARFLNFNLLQVNPKTADGVTLDKLTYFPTNPPGPNMIQIGTEGGLLEREVVLASPKPLTVDPVTGNVATKNLLIGCAERADVIIDFTGQAGKEFVLYNDAPCPFPGGAPTTDFFFGNSLNPVRIQPNKSPDTRQCLRIKVIAATVADPQPVGRILDSAADLATGIMWPQDKLLVDPPNGWNPGTPVPPLPYKRANGKPLYPLRKLTLNEDVDAYGRLTQLIGTTSPNARGTGYGMEFLEGDPTEVVSAGSTEVWEIYNLSADTHPMHIHLANAQILQRAQFDFTTPIFEPIPGTERGPEANELGFKETFLMHPGEVISLIMKFDLPPGPVLKEGLPRETPQPNIPESARTGGNEYVWHCHILEHEEHDMMRSLVVV